MSQFGVLACARLCARHTYSERQCCIPSVAIRHAYVGIVRPSLIEVLDGCVF